MKNADKFVVGGQVYDVLSPATFGDYMETIGSACINPDGYAENKLFLAYDDNVQKLFRATAAIAYSELLIKDTNCEPTTMAEALANALSAGGVSYDNTDSGLTASNVQDAIDEVNGDVETVNNDLSNEKATRSAMGAHNLLWYNLDNIKLLAGGSWSGNVCTKNGGTITFNDDGSVIVNGTFTSYTEVQWFIRLGANRFRLPDGSYKLYCNCNDSNISFSLGCTRNNAFYQLAGGSKSVEQVFELLPTDGDMGFSITINVGTYSNVLVKTMILAPTDTNYTQTPYAKTNRELTEEQNEIILDNLSTSNIKGRLAINGKIAVLYLNIPKTAMTQNTEYDAGTLPITLSGMVYMDLKGNGRDYTVKVSANGSLTITCKSTLPSDGKPAIAISIPLNII